MKNNISLLIKIKYLVLLTEKILTWDLQLFFSAWHLINVI